MKPHAKRIELVKFIDFGLTSNAVYCYLLVFLIFSSFPVKAKDTSIFPTPSPLESEIDFNYFNPISLLHSITHLPNPSKHEDAVFADHSYSSLDIPKTITSSGSTTVTSTITVPGTGTGIITNLDLISLNIVHTYLDDLTIKLESPAGTEITLLSGHCSFHDDLSISFDDEGSSFFTIPCPATDGQSYQAAEFLHLFNGEDPVGIWTLTVEDRANLDGGSLNGWGLRIITDTHLNGPCVIPGCTTSHNTSGSCINYTIVSGDTLCILEDYNCQITFNGGAVYIAPGVNFSPINANNFTGTIINCGTTNFGSITFGTGAVIENRGVMNFTGSLGVNGLMSFNNHAGGEVNISTNFNLQNGSSFVNYGIVNASGEFKVTNGSFINDNQLSTTGNFVTETASSSVTNNGLVISQSDININPNSNVVNNCTFNALNKITVDTDLQNNGLLFSKNGTGSIEINATASFTNNGDVVANDLLVSGDVLGNGFFWISGVTNLNGSGSFGTDNKGLNIYDSSTPGGGQFFDTQSGTVDLSVTNAPPSGTDTIPDESALMLTCSPVLLTSKVEEICNNGIDDDLDGLTDCADPDCTFEVFISAVDETCAGDNDGTATASVDKGATAPISYVWSDGQTNAMASGWSAGAYTVTVTDGNGCTATADVTISSGTCTEICNDGTDNDGDGYVDCFDSDCPCYAPFICDVNALYQTLRLDANISGEGVIGDFVLYRIDPASASFIFVANLTNQGLTSSINSIGYHQADGFIYGINSNAPYQLYRINRLGQITHLGNVTGLTGINQAGVIDGSGNFYVTGNSQRLYNIDITTLTATLIGNTNITCSDIAISPVDGQIYGWSFTDRQLVAIDPSTGTRSLVGVANPNYGTIGSFFFNTQGELIAYGDNELLTATSQETLAKIDVSTGAVQVLGTGPNTNVNDGCSCAYGVEITKTALDTICPGNPLTYTFTIFNRSGIVLNNVNFEDTTSNSLTFSSDPYDISAGLSLTGTTNGQSEAYLVINNIPVGTSSFKIDLNIPDPYSGGNPYINTAYLNNLSSNLSILSDTIVSDNPSTLAIGDPTETFIKATEILGNGIDDDCDGLIDCADFPFSLSTTTTDLSCDGASDGSIDLTASGGTGALTYSWTTGATTEDITGLTAGTYTVTITDANACTTTSSATVSAPSALSANSSATDASCNGDNDGSIDLTASGGTGALTYSWTTGATTEDITGLLAGTYTVTITDANACTTTSSATVSAPSALSASSSATDANCNGGNDGSIDLTASGGTGALTYSWTTGATTEDITGLPAGTYTVTITDANACTTTNSATVSAPSVLSASSNATDASCNGGNDGSIDLTASGGTGALTYSWTTGATTEDITGLTAGTYTVTITDANACTTTSSATVSAPSALSASSGATDASCNGGNDGSINLTASGGTGALTYSWTTGATTEDITGLLAGTYTVTITDANACTITNSTTVSESSALSASTTAIDASCNGDNDGSIDLTASGGTGALTYSWSTGATTEDISGLIANTYTVTVTDANGCATIITAIVDEPAILTANGSATDVSCNGGNNGSINLMASGGTGALTYSWSTGAATEDINSLIADTYTVTVTDANACTTTTTVNVGEAPAFSASNSTIDASCNGNNDGSIDLTASGGTGALTYSWTTGATTEDIMGLTAGTYTVTITDANACTTTSSATVAEPSALNVSATAANVSCNSGNDGSIDLTASGGTGALTYSWNTGATTEDITGLTAGTYTVTVTDENNCTTSASISVGEADALAANAGTDVVVCNNNSTNLLATASGGTAPYTYSWDNALGAGANHVVSPTAATVYTLTVTDANGCVATDDVTISVCTPALNISKTLTIPVSGSADVGETVVFEIEISNPGPADISNIPLEDVFDASCMTFEELRSTSSTTSTIATSKDNWISQSNQNNNTGIDDQLRIERESGRDRHALIQFDLSSLGNVRVIAARLNMYLESGEANGLIVDAYAVSRSWDEGNGNGGNGEASWRAATSSVNWSNRGGDYNPTSLGSMTTGVTGYRTLNLQTSVVQSWIEDPANNYGLILRSSGGTQQLVFTSQEGINARRPYLEITTVPVVTTDYSNADTLRWNNLGSLSAGQSLTFNAHFRAINGCLPANNEASVEGAIDVSGNPVPRVADQATVNIQFGAEVCNDGIDNDGDGLIDCDDILDCAPTLSATVTAVDCYGNASGAIDVTVSGGTGTMTYNWSTTATSEDLTNLTAGTYTLTVTDANNCTTTQTITVTEPDELVITPTVTNVTCNGGSNGLISLDVGVTGGTPGYTYIWDDLSAEAIWAYEGTTDDITGNDHHAISTLGAPAWSTDAVERGQSLDFNGSTKIRYSQDGGFMETNFSERTIAMWIKPDNLTGVKTLFEESSTARGWAMRLNGNQLQGANRRFFTQINAGSITFPNDGQWHHVAFVYDNGEFRLYLDGVPGTPGNSSFSSSGGSGADGGIGGTISSDAFGSSGDNYYQGLMDFVTYHTIALTQTQINDLMNNNGNRTGLPANGYTVTVVDENDCSATETITVSEPPALVASSVATDADCFGENSGSIDLSVSGGSAPYTFTWSGGAGTSEDPSGLIAGTYTVTITDGNDCTIAETATIGEAPAITITPAVTLISCSGGSDGAISVSVNGGTGSYTYNWSGGLGTTNSVSGLAMGTYTVTITDANNCTQSESVLVNEVVGLSLTFSSGDASCSGGADGSIDITASGGTLPYTYNWNSGLGTVEDPTGLSAGTYQLTITDANSCTYTESFTISEPAAINVSLNSTDVSCAGGTDGGVISATVTGGTPDYTFEWLDIQPEAHWTFEGTLEDVSGNGHNPVGGTGSFNISTDSRERTYAMYYDNSTRIQYNNGSTGFMESGFTRRTISMWIKPDNLVGTEALFEEGGQYYGISLQLQDAQIRGAVSDWPDRAILNGPNLPAAGQWYHLALVYDNGWMYLYLDGTLVASGNSGLGSVPASGSNGGIGGTFGTDAFGSSANNRFDGLMDDVRFYNIALNEGQVVSEMNNDGTRSGLSTGTYTVRVIDNNGCVELASTNIGEPTPLASSLSALDVQCFGGNNGAIVSSPSGATPPYTYNWSTGSSNKDISGLSIGTYTVTITDANGCTLVDDVTIGQPSLLTVSASVTSNYGGEDVSCIGASDGNGTASASGGNSASYDYSWSNGDNTAFMSGVSAGTYTVTVTDGNGCTATTSITLQDPPSITVTTTVTSDYNGSDVTCPGAGDGAALASASNSTGPYNYNWSDGQTGPSLTWVSAGVYTVTVTDAFGCTATETVTIQNPPGLTVNVNVTSSYNGFDLSCDGESDGTALATPTGGSGTYTYDWSNGTSSGTLNSVSSGTYTVTVTDGNGCTASGNVTLGEPPALTYNITASDPTDCGVNDGIILINASGGTGVYEYRLDGGPWQTTNSFTGLAPGDYDVYARTASSSACEEGPVVVTISLPEAPSIDNITLINPTNGSSNDGGVLITASGSGVQINYRLLDSGGTPVAGWQVSNLFNGLDDGDYTVQIQYYNQNCISQIPITLTAGGGIVGSTGGIDYCSGTLNSTQFVEMYYVPGPENQLLTSLQSMNPGSCGLSFIASDPVHSYASVGVVETGTIIIYDHWEDGYEPNLAFPIQSTTEVWGDGNAANGMPPGYTTDILRAGESITLSNDVVTATRGSVIDYDGGDKMGGRGNLSMTRLIWADRTETLFAGALEVYPTAFWGSNYKVPVGEDRDVNSMFEYTGAIIMAGESGATVQIDADASGGYETTINLSEGQSHLIDGGINAGAVINASADIQVHLLTGDRCVSYESRFFTLRPTDDWSDSYFAPVSTENDGSNGTNGNNHPTYVHLYNPNSSSITINWETNAGTQTSFSLAANSTAYRELPDGTGAHFWSNGNQPFYAVATIDSDPDGTSRNSGHDWGYALIPEAQLSSQISLVGFAPGNDPSNPNACCNSFIWWLWGSSENPGNEVSNIDDGNVNTFWHTEFGATTPSHPHSVEIDLGTNYNFEGFRYTPRQDGGQNGTIAGYRLEYWDGSAWITGASGTLASNTDVKEVYFPVINARFVRLVATSEINGGPWTSIAELDLLIRENSSPVWITAGYPQGSSSTGSVTVCVDLNGDGGAYTDLNGVQYDLTRTLNEFDLTKIYDPDGDQSGMRIWVCDGSDALIAGAWGQDPATASGASPAIDLGVGLPNGIPFSSYKCVDLSKDYNQNGLFDECDEVIYTVTIQNTGALPLSAGTLNIRDTLPNGVTYIPNSTVLFQGAGITNLPDDLSPSSAFPIDQNGYTPTNVILPGDSLIVRFEASIDPVLSAGFIQNLAYVTNNSKVLTPEVTFPVEDPTSPTVSGIPADTTINCHAYIPPPPFTDTCMLEFFVPQSEMSIQYVDSEELGGGGSEPAFLILDGNPNTHWHTEYRTSNPAHPHEIQLDLGGVYDVTGFRVLPRQLSSNGRIADYEFYVSTDGVSWGSPVASGTWLDNALEKEVDITKVNVRYVRLRALSEVNGNPWTTLAEFNVKYCATDITYAENNPGGDCNYNITRTWTITNYCGRTGTSTQTISIQDTTAPVLIGVPADITVNATAIPPEPAINCSLGTNLAQGKTVTQSSVAFGGAAGRAIDGNTSGVYNTGSVTHTQNEAQPWWQVDLGAIEDVGIIELYNRTDCCSDRLSNYYVLVSDDPFVSNDLFVLLGDPNVSNYFYSTTAETPTILNINRSARYVRVQLQGTNSLSLAEVNVYENVSNCILTTDNCDNTVAVVFSADTTYSSCSYIIERTWTSTDRCGNTVSETQQIDVDAPMAVSASVSSNYNGRDVSCIGASDGAISATQTGGVNPVSYTWSSGQSGANITGLAAGTYTVTATDNNGCTATTTVTLIDPPSINVITNVTSNYNGEDISCIGASDGRAFVSASGGTGTFDYLWFDGTTTQTINNLGAGTYAVTVTDDNNCTAIGNVTLDSPSPMVLNTAVTSDYNGEEISCNGASDGAIISGATGGVAPYSYLWNTGATSASLSGLPAGTYTVTATDANGCTTTDQLTLSDPTPLTANTIVTSDYNGSQISCSGASDGSGAASASGGTGSYTYNWSGGESTSTLTNLSAGTYRVTITDANGCQVVDSIVLVDPPLLNITLVVTTDYSGYGVSCNGATDGAITSSINGGTGAYTFAWNSGQTTADLSNIGAGDYTLTVTDENGCQDVATITVTEPTPLVIDNISASDPLLCNGSDGVITIDASGGIGTYEYRLGTGPWQSSNVFSALSAGSYMVYVRFSTGICEIGPENVILNNPIPRTCPITAAADPLVICSSDVEESFTVSSLPDASGYTWTVPAGMLINSGQGTNSLSVNTNGLTPGNYQVCVVTNSDCGNSAPCCIDIEVIPCVEVCDNGVDDDGDGLVDCDDPDCQIVADIQAPPSACIHETVSISAVDVGGTAVYNWDFGSDATPASATGLGPHTVEYGSCGKKDITLSITINGCNFTDTDSIIVEDIEAPTLTTPASNITVECNGSGNNTQLNNWLASNGGATATDNCGAMTWTNDFVALSDGCGETGTTDVTFTVTDECGNATQTTASFTIIDTSAPSISNVPADTTINCEEAIPLPASPTADDSCSTANIAFHELIIRRSLAGRRAGCTIDVIASNINCNDNGTPSDTSDDTFTFDLEITGNGAGSGWMLEIAGSSQTGNYGDVISSAAHPLTAGVINFIITDQDSPDCKSYISLQPPAGCNN